MKVFVCAMVCLAGLANAGAVYAQGVQGGIKAGVTSGKITVTGLQGFEPEAGTGVLGGGWLSLGSDRARVQTEVIFATRRFSSPLPGGDIRISSRSIDVPVLFVGRLRPAAKVHPLLFAGPYVTFITKSTQTVGSTSTDLDSQLKDMDMGVAFGLGLEVATRRGAIVLDARFALGGRDLSEAADTTFKSRTFMASFGYRF